MQEKMFKNWMIKCIYVFGLFGLLIMLGCSRDQLEMSNKVILVFQPGKGAIYLGQNLRIKVKYVDDYLISHEFRPGEFGQNRYVISTLRDYIDIAYQYETTKTRHFFFRNGDSVRIQLEEKWPFVEILNRKTNKYESNFEKNKQQDLYGGKPSALEDYYYYWYSLNNPINPVSGSIISEELKYLKEKALSELDQEAFYIDSLFKFEIFDREITNFYKLKNAYEHDKLRFFNDSAIDFSNTDKIESIVSKINRASIDSVKPVSLYTYYDNFITQYYKDYLSKNLDNSTDLDSITGLEYYSTPFGRSMLFKYADQLLLISSVNKGKVLLESFDKDTLLEYWSNYFYSKYNLYQNFDTNWSISDKQNSTIKFKDLLRERQGSLLYVDFWASWCLESIKEMSALEKLYKDYANKGFSIVHISVDKDKEKWEWAENQYLGFNRWNSYLLINDDLPIIRKTFVMNSLPRYLLIDQKGNLVHGNAPKPSSKELMLLIEGLLNTNVR